MRDIKYEQFWCVRAPKRSGEAVRSALAEMGALQRDAAVRRDQEHLYFPLKDEIDVGVLEVDSSDLKLLRMDFEYEEKQTFTSILGFTPSFEMIGDLAIIDSDDPDAAEIADAILLIQKNISTVLGTLSPVTGEFRVREFCVLAGVPKTQTVHREYGCRYKVDLARVYFTPRLGTERKRIADQIEQGDVVVDMFAGVGPFSILIAKTVEQMQVIAIDKNPVAIEYLERNAQLNRIKNIKIICGDVRDIAPDLRNIADHLIMNLPHSANEFLDCALTILKPGGVIHYYDIAPDSDPFTGAREAIERAASDCGLGGLVRVLDERIVRSYSPHQYNVALDVRVG